MSDEAALLRAIGAHPDEDTPRLMYADWLDEHGRAERAEYIRVQIARQRKFATGEHDAQLYNREVELYRAHAAQWLRELMPPGYEPSIVAGERFPHALVVRAVRESGPLAPRAVLRICGRFARFTIAHGCASHRSRSERTTLPDQPGRAA